MRVLRDEPVVDDQHRGVGELRQRDRDPAVRVDPARQERPAVHVEHDAAFAVGGQHAGRAHQLGEAVRQPDGGAHGAGGGHDRAGDEVDQPEGPGQVRDVAARRPEWA